MNWSQRVAALAVVALLALLGRQAAIHSIDFPVYHRAAQQLLAGNFELYPAEVYEGHPVPSQGFRYLPAVAVLFLPFGWLSLEPAAFVFFALKLAALWWVGATVARRAGSTGWGQRAFVVAFVAAGGYLAEELRFGNAHFFCIALMVLAYDRAESGRVVVPGLALAIAIAMKVTPVALLVYFAMRKRGRLCLATIAFLALLVVLPAAIIGPSANARELRAFTTYATEKLDEGDNYSLRGVLVRYLTLAPPDVSHVPANVADLPMPTINILWLAGLFALGLAALAAVWRDNSDPVARLLEFSIVLTGILIASPHTQRRYYVALYVPVAVLLAVLPRARSTEERRLILTGLAAVAAPATVLPLVFGGRRLALLYEAGSPYFFGALVLFGVLVVMTLRRKDSPAAIG